MTGSTGENFSQISARHGGVGTSHDATVDSMNIDKVVETANRGVAEFTVRGAIVGLFRRLPVAEQIALLEGSGHDLEAHLEKVLRRSLADHAMALEYLESSRQSVEQTGGVNG